MSKRQLIGGSVWALLAAGLNAPAEAQEGAAAEQAAETAAAAEKADQEVIIVTATRREQTLQEAPVAVSAFSGDRLQDLGAQEFSDYSRLVPGLTAVDRGPGQKKYILRGINSENSPRLAPIVQQYLNEFPLTLTGGGQADIRLYDIERVEVLRGPQGTLFGSGSMGGTIRTITRPADLNDLSGSAEVTLSATEGGGANILGHAVLNAPIIEDVLSIRLLAYGERLHGFIHNVGVGDEDENFNRVTGGRVAIAFAPASNLRFDLLYMHQDLEAGGQNEVMTGYQSAPFGPPPFLPPGTPWYPTLAEPLGDLEVLKGISEHQSDRNDIVNLVGSWQVAGLTLLSSTTYYQRRNVFEQDITELQGFGGYLRNEQTTDTLSQELRVSDDQGTLKWVAGAYYLQAEQNPESFFQAAFFPDDSQFFRSGTDATIEQRAVFAEGVYDLTESLTATVGLRYGEHDFRSNTFELAPNFLTGAPAGAVGPVLSGSDEAVTYKFQMAYRPNDDMTFYGVASSGFRGGGANDTSLAPDAIPPTFESDSLWNYELGSKLTLFDRRVTWNTAIFYIDWSNIQVTAFADPPFGPPGSIAYTGNAGAAEVYGVETELSAQLTDRLSVALSGSYISAELTQDQPAPPPGAPPPRAGIPGLAGDDLPNVPNFSGSALIDYSIPIAGPWNGFATGILSYTGESHTNFRPNDPSNRRQNDYALVNLRAGIENDLWRVSLFVNNLTNVRAQLFVNSLSGLDKTTINRPRTWGLAVSRRF